MHSKSELRKHFSKIRKETDKSYEEIIRKIFLASEEYINAKTIFAYYPIGDEFDTLPILAKALEDGKSICLPKCNKSDHSMKFVEIRSLKKDLSPGNYNIPEPSDNNEKEKLPDLFIIPALSCDPYGNRLGYGGGYYDRYLRNHPHIPKIVLMNENQISDRLPCEDTDIPIDIIITEGGYRKAL